MKYKKSITDILQGFIDSLNYMVTIYQITPLAGGTSWLLSVNDVMHAQVGFSLIINGNQYKIIAVDDTECNNTITVSGTVTPTGNSFTMYQVRFFHGTAKQTGEEITSGTNVTTAYPMLWLWDDMVSEKFNEDPEDAIERASTLKLFFLTKSIQDDKRAEALEDTYVKPMRKFKERFMKIVNEPFSGVQTWEQTDNDKNYSQFTITYTVKGESKNLWGGTLSGIGIDIVLNFYKQSGECC